ncbi:MAG: hypothetical protein ACOY0T_12530 [Myxococcota bacterium]
MLSIRKCFRRSFFLNPFGGSFAGCAAWIVPILASSLGVLGCSSDNSDDKTGGNGGENQACADDKRVGTLTLRVVPPTTTPATVPGYSEFGGSVNDKVNPSDVWVENKKEGGCRLITGPKLSCATACPVGEVCAGNNVCVSAPAGQDAGAISISGLSSAVSAKFLTSGVYYQPLTDFPFPPAAAGADVTLQAAGAKVPAFSLKASGIDPMIMPESQIQLDTTKPLTITWNAPSAAAKSRVTISLDLAHHGNVAAKLVCDEEDTGSATIPVSMLTALAAEGIAGFPSVSVTRRSVASTTLAAGCVEFSVASFVNRELTLPGLVSCSCPNSTCEPCTADQMCKANYTCG